MAGPRSDQPELGSEKGAQASMPGDVPFSFGSDVQSRVLSAVWGGGEFDGSNFGLAMDEPHSRHPLKSP